MLVAASGGGSTFIDIPGGWATIIVALITFVVGPWASTIVAARVSGKVKKVSEDVAATREQVENNHKKPDGTPINLREEQDDRHGEIVGLLRDHGELLEEHGNQLKRLTDSDQEQNEWIDDFNTTWPRNKFMPPAKHRAPEPPNGETP